MNICVKLRRRGWIRRDFDFGFDSDFDYYMHLSRLTVTYLHTYDLLVTI